MKLFLSAVFLIVLSLTSFAQVTTLRCDVNGVMRFSDGDEKKIEPSSTIITVSRQKGKLFIDVQGNSDYNFSVGATSFTNSDKTNRYEGIDLSDESKYAIISKGYKLPSNKLESESAITLNRVSGNLNYKTKIIFENQLIQFTLIEASGECSKINSLRKF